MGAAGILWISGTWYAQTTEVEDGIRIAALGPYPSRGEYEHCFTLESASGEFISLTPAACDWIVHAIEWSRKQPRRELRGAIAAREARRALRWDRDADDLLDDAVPAFHGAPFVGVVGEANAAEPATTSPVLCDGIASRFECQATASSDAA